METKSVMIVGVGGQGSLLASRILGNVLLQQGFAVKVSEVHGMSQRGGSVVTYVKYGDAVYSPTVEKGEADVIISFELLEAARWAGYLKKGGKIALVGFGTLATATRPARKGHNPRTGKAIKIAAKKVVKFKAAANILK